MCNWYRVWPFGMSGFGMVLSFLFWGLVIFGLFRFASSFGAILLARSKQSPALEIARKRYAQGEIDKNEFDEITGNLS